MTLSSLSRKYDFNVIFALWSLICSSLSGMGLKNIRYLSSFCEWFMPFPILLFLDVPMKEGLSMISDAERTRAKLNVAVIIAKTHLFRGVFLDSHAVV